MKKVIISFIILLICVIAAFIFGYIHIPPDNYAVIHTKIFGFDNKVYSPGANMWRWEKLLPTVLTLYKFNLLPYKTELKSPIKGSLFPSGNDYAAALGENFDFSFEFTVSLEFVIKQEKLKKLVEKGLRPENLPAWYEETSLKLYDYLVEIVVKDPEFFLPLKKNEYLNKIQSKIADNKNFNTITLIAVDPKNVNIPDYDAYSAIKERYLEYLTFKSKAHIEIVKAENKLYLEAIQKEIDIIKNIEKYRELITPYPSVIEFLHNLNEKYTEEALKGTE